MKGWENDVIEQIKGLGKGIPERTAKAFLAERFSPSVSGSASGNASNAGRAWTDDAVSEIRSIDAKIPVAVARSFLKERLSTSGLGKAGGDAGVAGRAETIREGFRERVGRHAATEKALRALSEEQESD